MEADHGQHKRREHHHGETRKRPPLLRSDLAPQVRNAARQADDDAGEDDQRHAVAHASLGDLLTQPHDEGRARGQRQNRHKRKADTGVIDQRLAVRPILMLEVEGDRQRLDDAEDDRQVARVLRDLCAGRARPLSCRRSRYGQATVINCKMIEAVMYGMMPRAKIAQLAKITAAEEIDDAQYRALILLKQRAEHVGIDSRRGGGLEGPKR